MRLLLAYLIVLSCFSMTFSQDELTVEEIKANYKKVADYYDRDYSLSVTYRSYIGHQSTVVEDKQTGFVVQHKDIIISGLLGAYSVQNDQIKVSIDSSEQMIGILYPDTLHKSVIFDQEQYELSKQRIKKAYTEKKRNETLMSFDFKPGFAYEKVSVLILPNGMIKEMTLYYASYTEYEDSNGMLQKEKAKVIISFSEKKQPGKLLTPSDIVNETKNGWSLTEPFKGFELIDFRYQTN